MNGSQEDRRQLGRHEGQVELDFLPETPAVLRGNGQSVVTAKEVEAVQRIAADLFRLNSSDLDALVTTDALKEICDKSKD